MLTGIRAGFLVSTALAVSLAGCGAKTEPQQLSDQEKQQKMKEMQDQYQKLGGMKPGMSKEDMIKAMGKYKPEEKGK